MTWYADPSGATERSELRCDGFKVFAGANAMQPGIAAVSAPLENGTLRVLEGRYTNLLSEAALYRYSDDRRDGHAEVSLDEHNHALAALRYLVSRLDARQMAGNRRTDEEPDSEEEMSPAPFWCGRHAEDALLFVTTSQPARNSNQRPDEIDERFKTF